MTTYETCPKCDVSIGETHEEFCGVSRCKEHGYQRISCSMSGGCSPTKFTGYWPRAQEAIERDWYYYAHEKKGATPCSGDHEGALPDLNRVLAELSWNSDLEKYE